MNIYFVDKNNKKKLVQVEKINKTSQSFSFEEWMVNGEKVFVKNLFSKIFYSLDQKVWKKLVSFQGAELSIKNENYKIYPGFLPSGMGEIDASSLRSEMPGKIIKVFIKPGEKVTKGKVLMIMEAMKMENEVKAPADGTVNEVLVSEGQTITAGTVLIKM